MGTLSHSPNPPNTTMQPPIGAYRFRRKRSMTLAPFAADRETVSSTTQNGTIVELLEATPARPPGFVHVGFEVDDMNAAVGRLKQSNVKVAQPRVGRTKATVAEVDVPDGVNVELLELGPDSMQRKAIDSWGR